MKLSDLLSSVQSGVGDYLKNASAPNRLTTPVTAAAPATPPTNYTPFILAAVGLLVLIVFALRR